MPDMLVSLYSPILGELKRRTKTDKVTIRPALPPEMGLVVGWVRENFSENWASEVTVAFTRRPVACLIAVDDGKLVGFACYDTTAPGFFGPTGVDPVARGKGIGVALLSDCLDTMKTLGHAYAFIGDAGPVDFYAKTVGAVPIPAPDKGIYQGMLRRPSK
ncbi:GNAT family N-acetyltransferase [Ensifer adhaerens]|uniref:GNAT family N-acetyltransferase n=1 Tax=Ensifer adhaerens TaxID=106592 RepID=A0A9Q9DCW8_ENSAD|nr:MULTISPECIES: GNAT family N-acetyltransferase [Ensifer]KSV64516.1 GNAT family acetyltransferase [Sinorhizobium sp. GL2]KSV70335.1 GNAT family acetyltransferase [Sinorhizobium sp. GW3]OWZ93749.1 N-acetyltransferase [Sinorhizobium sp. LM21]ANK75259.1 GNAT family acetyltransferase [Ensifer adhaerens]KDP75773.1 GNAT family acetyltransferase [Ensifer adhaerens]